jgi:hypothetical protein
MSEVSARDGPTEKASYGGESMVTFGFCGEQFIYDRGEVMGLYFGKGFAFELKLEVGVEKSFVVNHSSWTDALGLALEEDRHRVFKVQRGIVSLSKGALCEEFSSGLACFRKGNNTDTADLVACAFGAVHEKEALGAAL